MKEPSVEHRALLAALLSLVVVVLWQLFFAPKPPTGPPRPAPSPAPGGTSASAVVPVPPQAAAGEETIVVENDLYRVVFSNRGAVVRSWELKKYTDDRKPPHTLDLVHPDAGQQLGGWPLALTLDDVQLEAQANSALFTVTPDSAILRAPGEIQFGWSDGHLAVTKRLQFDRSYLVQVETNVTLEGKPLAHGVAWRGGFGDTTVYQAAEQVQVFYSAGGKLDLLPYKKLGVPDQPAQRQRRAGAFDYVGIEDHYFVAAFLPRLGSSGGLALWDWRLDRETPQEGKLVKEPVAEMAAGSTAAGPLALRLFVGPKDLDELKKLTPPLSALVQFGWLDFIAAPLFYLLRWLHGYVPNYGWAIILMTLLINMVLFPLKVKSWRSMQKMQKVAPEVKSIQDRYKKYSLRDPRRQEMNQEVMALYKREGINPMGGCLPMVLQMPIWFGLYRMLNVTIELRHAPWFWWVRDLSARDPYYILPVLMAVTMYVMQKMTPTTASDPTQQRMMNMMPIMFGGMFVVFPVSSGLVLYILSSNVVGMAQQWYLNRTAPVAAKAPRGKNGRKK